MQADYIESAEYRQVCLEHGVTRPLSQDMLLQFLHDLVVVINFRRLQYFDTQILNPLWLTNGVYRIINSGLVAESKPKRQVTISPLLDSVEEPAMRDEAEQLPVKAFVSCSHKNLDHLKSLRTALASLMRLQKIQLWDDRDIDPGEEWRKVLFQQLEEADIVICLVSADFMASEFLLPAGVRRSIEGTCQPRKFDYPHLAPRM